MLSNENATTQSGVWLARCRGFQLDLYGVQETPVETCNTLALLQTVRSVIRGAIPREREKAHMCSAILSVPVGLGSIL